jgi:hypothetical protein
MSHPRPHLGTTITGVDEKTPIDRLPDCFEYAVLYTRISEGRNRYPSRRRAHQILTDLRAAGHRTALHVCGSVARAMLREYTLPDLTHLVDRIQVNGSIGHEELRMLCALYSDHTIITQSYFTELNYESPENHAILVDGSGGRGITPTEWVAPKTPRAVGFAGGLGPDTLGAQLPLIWKVAKAESWIDMESGVRDENDWLDVGKVRQVRSRICNIYWDSDLTV